MTSPSPETLDSLALKAHPFRYYMRRNPRAFLTGVGSLLLTNSFDVLTPLVLKFGIDAVTERDTHKLLLAIAVTIAFKENQLPVFHDADGHSRVFHGLEVFYEGV